MTNAQVAKEPEDSCTNIEFTLVQLDSSLHLHAAIIDCAMPVNSLMGIKMSVIRQNDTHVPGARMSIQLARRHEACRRQ